MNTTALYLSIGILILIALFLGWRGFVLNQRINVLTKALRYAAEQSERIDLPDETVELSHLFSAISLFNRHFETQLTEIRAQRERLAAVLEQISDGILISGQDSHIQFANPAAHKLLEHEGKGLVGRSVAQALRHHQFIETWQKCKDTGQLQSGVFEKPFQNSFLQLVVAPDQFAPGGTLLLVQDLTRLRRLETVRRDFISNISHELRTPLASLKALTETLQDGALDDPLVARRFMGRIETEVDALTQMAQELLDLSRIESGQVVLELQEVAPDTIVQRVAERMRAQAERAEISLITNSFDGLPNVHVDLARIEQVFVNLIHNAIKFTSTGGTVTLSVEVDSGNIRFAVADTGIGIPSRDLPRIFERFYKADRARRSGGTGLGLSISKHLVEAHQGKIWVESFEGRGSTFYVSLPITQEN